MRIPLEVFPIGKKSISRNSASAEAMYIQVGTYDSLQFEILTALHLCLPFLPSPSLPFLWLWRQMIDFTFQCVWIIHARYPIHPPHRPEWKNLFIQFLILHIVNEIDGEVLMSSSVNTFPSSRFAEVILQDFNIRVLLSVHIPLQPSLLRLSFLIIEDENEDLD